MRRLGFISVLVGILVTSVAATATIKVSVTPLEGTPRTKFTVSFVVDRKVTGYRWLVVRVVSPGLAREKGCETAESAAVTYAPKGRRVNVVLQPLDKGRWCSGVYSGDIFVEYRTPCGGAVGAGPDEGPCYTHDISPRSTLARFRFTVKPD